MPTWPAELPQAPLRDGLSFGHPNGLLSSPVDQGPPKVRRKTTTAPWPISCTYIMTDAQIGIFQSFVNLDLTGGALSFTMPNPANSGQTATMRINPESMPQYAPEEPGFWMVRLSLLLLP